MVCRPISYLAACLSLLVLSACPAGSGHGTSMTGRTVGAVTIGQPMPDLAIKDLGGKRRRLSDFRGKVVLVDVWASWCEPCKTELPMLDEMAARLRADGVEIVAISIDEERANMQDFMARRKNWRVRFFHDPTGQVPERLQPTKMPTSYILDRRGIVQMVNEGFEPSDADAIEQRLKTLARRG